MGIVRGKKNRTPDVFLTPHICGNRYKYIFFHLRVTSEIPLYYSVLEHHTSETQSHSGCLEKNLKPSFQPHSKCKNLSLTQQDRFRNIILCLSVFLFAIIIIKTRDNDRVYFERTQTKKVCFSLNYKFS